MDNRTIKFVQAGVFFIVTILIVSSTTIIASHPPNASFSSTKKMMTLSDSSRDETELKYYIEEDLSTVIGVCGNVHWKSAIRLTQDETAAYSDWTMTKVNVAFNTDNGCPYIYVRIYIFDKGNTSTRPGPIIVADTIAKLNTTGVTTVPLVTPVNLSGHEELWVAVDWNDTFDNAYYAWLDTVTGPHIPQKGDWYYLNNAWGEIYTGGADYDGNWGIGAIIEGAGLAELSIGNIEKGYFGFNAEVQNTGDIDALNVTWSYTVKGGFLHHNKTATGTDSTLVAHGTLPISVPIFILFGKINIAIYAQATNALKVNVRISAFVLGKFLLGNK